MLPLFEEGHCLRDRARSCRNFKRRETVDAFGISNISTIVRGVANGCDVTLLPEIAA